MDWKRFSIFGRRTGETGQEHLARMGKSGVGAVTGAIPYVIDLLDRVEALERRVAALERR
jgi:hypothetical protein